MLVLTRKSGESVHIGEAVVHFGEIRRGHVKVAIEAAPHVRIVRGELIDDRASAVGGTPVGAAEGPLAGVDARPRAG